MSNTLDTSSTTTAPAADGSPDVEAATSTSSSPPRGFNSPHLTPAVSPSLLSSLTPLDLSSTTVPCPFNHHCFPSSLLHLILPDKYTSITHHLSSPLHLLSLTLGSSFCHPLPAICTALLSTPKLNTLTVRHVHSHPQQVAPVVDTATVASSSISEPMALSLPSSLRILSLRDRKCYHDDGWLAVISPAVSIQFHHK